MDKALKMQAPIVLSAEAYDWFVAYLEEPSRDWPKLRKLFQQERRFECGADQANPRTT
jgi:uncharacterized protein (DUF1778 family)